MEEETGLELSLGLSVGDSSSKPNVKDAPSDPKGEEVNSSRLRGSNATISDDLSKKDFKSGLETQEPEGKQKSDLITQPQENFCTDLAISSTPVTDCSNDTRNNLARVTRCQEQLISSDRTSETEEEKSGTSKRKLPFEETNVQNMQESFSDHAEDQGAKKSSIAPFLRSSHVSNTIEDGSTGENEDVAESEAEGPQSLLVSQRDEIAKCSDTLKFNVKSVLSESSGIRAQGLREPCLSGRGSNPEYGRPTGENEDVAESEAEGPQSRLVSQRDEIAKCSDTLKFNVKSVLSESSGIRAQGLREPCLLRRGSNPEYGRPTGENEDVAESETEGPQSRLVSQRDEIAKCSDTLKFNVKSVPSESSGIHAQGLREPCLLGRGSNPKYGRPTGKNEDVAESEAEGPQSRLVSQRDEIAKCYDTLKFNVKSVLSESSGIRAQGLREPSLSGRGYNPEYGRPTIGIPLSFQPQRFMNVPYPVPTMVRSTSTGSNFLGYPSIRDMPMRCMPIPFGQRPAVPIPFGQRPAVPIPFGQRPAAPTANPNSMQVPFGYPSARLPTLETGSSWAFNYQPLRTPSFTGRQRATGVQFREHIEAGVRAPQGPAPLNIPGGPVIFSIDGNPSNLMIGGTVGSTKYITLTGTPVRSEDRGRPTNSTMPANEAMRNPATQGFPLEAQAIRAGIAPNLRIGGCGILPDLPWVTTTGPGPNGRTITGVTYAYDLNQFKVVCACHGFHMSPNEFRQHSRSVDPGSETNPNLTSFPPTNTRNPPQS